MQRILLLCFVLISRFSFAQTPSFEPWTQLVPSEYLPKGLKTFASNNNMDVIQYKGKYYMAFRTARVHFPTGRCILHILSSDSLPYWKHEKSIQTGFDLREPRFALFKNQLILVWFEGGNNMFKFQPRHVFSMSTFGEGWTMPSDAHIDGYVPWRLRERNDTLYMSVYDGRGLYTANHTPDICLYFSEDGYQWKRLGKQSLYNEHFMEEAEFLFRYDGSLLGTIRMEGAGSLVCKAPADSLYCWNCKKTRYKYDSAILFSHRDKTYCISRRNVDGPCDKDPDGTDSRVNRGRDLVKYSITRKVSALFEFNEDSLTLKHIIDFPSNGDNAYPALVQVDKEAYYLLNYSSNIHKKPKNWLRGQLGRTYIYQTTLHMNGHQEH